MNAPKDFLCGATACVLLAWSVPAHADRHFYDGAQRLVLAERSGIVTTFRYGPRGQLMQTCTRRPPQQPRCTQTLTAGGGESTIAESTGTEIRAFAFGPLGAEISDSGVGTRFLLSDQRQSVRAETNAASTLTARRVYDAWGNTEAQAGAFTTPFGFTGQRQLDAADGGLVHLGARHYDPALSRFLQPDAFAGVPTRPQSLNRYAYAEGNPIRLADPSGHVAVDVEMGVKGVIGSMDAFINGMIVLPVGLYNAGVFVRNAGGASVPYAPIVNYMANFREAIGTSVPGLEQDTAYRFGEVAMMAYQLGRAIPSVIRAAQAARNFSTQWGDDIAFGLAALRDGGWRSRVAIPRYFNMLGRSGESLSRLRAIHNATGLDGMTIAALKAVARQRGITIAGRGRTPGAHWFDGILASKPTSFVPRDANASVGPLRFGTLNGRRVVMTPDVDLAFVANRDGVLLPQGLLYDVVNDLNRIRGVQLFNHGDQLSGLMAGARGIQPKHLVEPVWEIAPNGTVTFTAQPWNEAVQKYIFNPALFMHYNEDLFHH